MKHLGIVIIGRNEGERLRRCLMSVVGRGYSVVYVDSNSSDGSPELAISLGADVVQLDLSRPFTMGRGRNAGWKRVEEVDPDVRFIQFIDGDCELDEQWLERAAAIIEAQPRVAIVCGRRRERFPERSIYNRMADIEWNTPIGEAKYCGGDAMIRVEALRQTGGYNPALIAGEEPDLCVRIRKLGWNILRIDAEMTLHDIAISRFGQWWKRCERTGFAFAEGVAIHGRSPERHWVHELRSTLIWGLVIPILIVMLAWPTRGLSLLLGLAYPLQAARIDRRSRKLGMPAGDARIWGWGCVLCRWPNAVGAIRYWVNHLLGRTQTLIEYKRGSTRAPRAATHDETKAPPVASAARSHRADESI